MELFIKKAGKDEIPIIHEIVQDAFSIYAQNLGLPHVVSALDETYGDIKRDLAQKTILVAYYKGEPIGTIRYEMLPDNIVYITRFGVKSKAQNCGVGKALVREVETQVRAKGAHIIALHTASKMTPLVRFYYSLGFYIHSTTTDMGYIRGLLCKELISYREIPAVNVNIK